MLPETNEPPKVPEFMIDVNADSRDHANLWELSAIWAEAQPVEIKTGPVAE
jgi:hypothetical protein